MLSRHLAPVKSRLEASGFFVEEGYEYLVPSPTSKGSQKLSLDLAAFLQSDRRDMQTIAVIAQSFDRAPSRNPFKQINRFLTPNLQLAVTYDYIQWWVPSETERPIHITNISSIEHDFIRYSVFPEELRRAREGYQEQDFRFD